MASEDDVLEVWEYDANGTRFVRGATLSVTYWRDQHEICRNAGVEFSPPQADKLAVISAGVYEGEPIEGIRYPAPSHMTGWWFLTNQYKGDESTVNSVHLYHVTAARPDIARYVALPVGHVFRSSPPRVWFEENVANQPIPE